jgi:hypothetical protein
VAFNVFTLKYFKTRKQFYLSRIALCATLGNELLLSLGLSKGDKSLSPM